MKHFSHQDGVSDAQETYPTAEPLEPENTTYSGIGAELYAARLRAGLELADVSQRLRIRLQHLESIERGAFDEIPGRIYAIGFLRTYAEFLGFDGDDIVNRFKAEAGGGAAPAKLVFPSPAPESRMPGSAIILIAMILAAAAYGAWYYMHDIQRIATELVSEVPERLSTQSDTADNRDTDTSVASGTAAVPAPTDAELSDKAVEPVAPGTTESTDETNKFDEPASADDTQAVETAAGQQAPETEPEPSAEEPPTMAAAPSSEQEHVAMSQPAQPAPPPRIQQETAKTETQIDSATERMAALPTPSQPISADDQVPAVTGQVADAATDAPVTVEQAPPPPPMAPVSQPFNDSDAPQEYGISNTDARVVLRARYDCWVQVRGANAEQFLTKVLRAGDTYHVPNRTDVRLYASDAGALEVLVDGRPIPPIGGPGEIVRDVSLEANILLNRG